MRRAVSTGRRVKLRVLRTRATPYTDKAGVFAGMIGVNEDITELRHAERGLEQALAQLQETTDHHRAIAARLSLATSISSLAMSEHDRDLRYTWAHNVSGDPIGKTPSEAFGETVGKPLEELLRRGLTEPQSEEFGLTVEGNALWLAIQTAPVYRAEGAAGVVASALDITHRKQNEQKLETLARELSHRVKNVFALVKAMVHQSARGRGVSHDFLATLDQRMTALASVQDALLSHDADKAILHELLESQVAHLSGVTSEGAHDITVPGRSAPYIALAVHELGTNATKYGSLSVPEGRVRLSWNRREDGFVTLVWHEEGGPRPESGRGKGFGTQLLTRVFAAATNGEGNLTLTETDFLAGEFSHHCPLAGSAGVGDKAASRRIVRACLIGAVFRTGNASLCRPSLRREKDFAGGSVGSRRRSSSRKCSAHLG